MHTHISVPASSSAAGGSAKKVYPKSLSIGDILRLGTVMTKKTEKIDLFTFDLSHLEWSTLPRAAEFIVEGNSFASGGFREAYKASSITEEFSGKTWVIKKYLDRALDDMELTKQTPEEHTKKSVQMHYLARNFALQLKQKIEREDLKEEFGETFTYEKVYMGKTSDNYVTVEEFIPGEFVKYMNNNGELCESNSEAARKAQAFAHFTYEKSEGKVIVLDLQGSGYTLYDPEVASTDRVSEDGSFQFCTGNLSTAAISNCFQKHKCNLYCNLLKLKLHA